MLSSTTAICPALTDPRAVVRVNMRRREPLAVGRGQLLEQRLQVERRVAQTDVARPADRAAVADHAVELDAGLRVVGPVTAAQAHRQAVVGIGGGVQTVAAIEGRGVGFGLGLGIGAGASPFQIDPALR